MDKMSTILIVDDDNLVLDALQESFIDDYNVIVGHSGPEALQLLKENTSVAVVILDIKMAKMDGLETASRIKEINPGLPIIFHTGYPGDFSEREIEKNYQPYDYVIKDERPTRLKRAVKNAIQYHSFKSKSSEIIEIARSEYGMVGKSSKMQEIYRTIEKIAPTESQVMITGPTGSGKELVAMAIHNRSNRAAQKIGILNCNHRQPDLIESELFGHRKGSFTGAVEDRIGLFEYADGGTVFLDEIGDLDFTTQAKLLRAIETGQIKTIGSPELRQVDVRVICATNKDLDKMVADKEFREDLYYRLKGVIINLPSLKERSEDIPDLVTMFAEQYSMTKSCGIKIFEPTAMDLLIDFDWPGNVRQLHRAVRSLIDLSISSYISKEEVADYLNCRMYESGEDTSYSGQIALAKRKIIIQALYQTNNNISAAARMLQMDSSNLHKIIKDLDIKLG